FGIPAFIVTFAGMLTFRGLTQIALQNKQISPFPDEFRALGSGFLPDLGGGTSAVEPLTLGIGIIATLFLVLQGIRQRRARAKYD
ncbi:sugar ABC transporter permease, partial [Pseudomonas sp. AB12(2023)]|nr:sugar ABC transporter permease [Pseudomonas sp. AB12(2023)]